MVALEMLLLSLVCHPSTRIWTRSSSDLRETNRFRVQGQSAYHRADIPEHKVPWE